ncbi:hypothetical protein ACFWHR_12105 [Leucobacter sp. NPDC058333]|uniref:hypothetical protein n=1 Tax=Leucobacter sp. NPDC058333 TaxID=3346450 RepID=UPI00366692BF
MSKKPSRTWAMVASLGIPLAIVGGVAMAISYVTLIDVARVNGLPLPELYPILIDVGSVSTMIAAAQFRLHGVKGRWLAYSAFTLLSGVSIVANATHAWRAADLTLTSAWAAAILASTPPAILLAITHLVMKLIPDEKERAKLQARRERAEAPARRVEVQHAVPLAPQPVDPPVEQSPRELAHAGEAHTSSLHLVDGGSAENPEISESEVRDRVLEFVREESRRPTGKLVGEWLGNKHAKTGQRFLKRMEDAGDFEEHEIPQLSQVNAH